MLVVESVEALVFSELSRPLTNCSDCEAAVVSLEREGEEEVFRSFTTVANADWAVGRSPELRALPSEAMSVDS